MEEFLEIGFEIRKSLIVSKLLKSAPQFFVWGTSMYYVITKGGGRGLAKCLLLLTGGGGGLRGHAYVINAAYFV